MKAVVRASVTAAAAILGPSSAARRALARSGRGSATQAAEPPADGLAGARVNDVIALAHAGGAERRLAHREAGEHP